MGTPNNLTELQQTMRDHDRDMARLDRNTLPNQSIPDTGEWRVDEPVRGKYYIVDAEGELVAVVTREADAARIVTDHTQAAAVPKLVEALREVRKAYNAGPSAERIRIAMDAAIDYVDAVLAQLQEKQ